MLSAEDFFAVCAGQWQTDRVYHYPQLGEVERSYTEFNAETLTSLEKHQISSSFIPSEFFKNADAIERPAAGGFLLTLSWWALVWNDERNSINGTS